MYTKIVCRPASHFNPCGNIRPANATQAVVDPPGGRDGFNEMFAGIQIKRNVVRFFMAPPNADMHPSPSWRKTLYIMVFCQVITSIGFSSIFPFLPLYVKSLGSVTSLGTEMLSGLVFSSQALTMMIASPIWGAVADRWGRKLMVERAMFGGALILGLMAFVRSAEELVLLRTIQGMITGTIGAANALVASIVPRERCGFAMGLLQVGLGAGVGLGPIIGGAVADAYGYRAAFYVTGALLAVAGLIVAVGVQEHFIPPARTGSRKPGLWREWRRILSAPGVVATYALRFLDSLSRMAFIPILPLFALELMAEASRVNSFTGLVIGAASTAAAVFSVFFGRLGDRTGHRLIVIACALTGFFSFFLQAWVGSGWQFLALQLLAGIAHGGIVTGVTALLARYTSCGEEGAVYGLDNSINSGARALAPMIGVSIAMWLGLRAVFGAISLLYLTAAALAFWRLPQAVICRAPERETRP
jgi:DHA1 family multidrug resistance protein-like MFS transporter